MAGEPSVPAFPPPPSRAMARRQIVMGGVMIAVGAAPLLLAGLTTAVPLVAGGVTLVALGLYLRASGEAVQVVNTSYNAITQGRTAEAEGLLDHAEKSFHIGYIRRIMDLQRAIIAMRRGDLEGALARTDAALARPLGVLARGQARVHTAAARGLRALLRASLGDREGAGADVAAVRADPASQPEALARAELAQAILLERSGDREALRAHLASQRRLLLGHASPRERAIVRAYQRMLKAPKTTVYRQNAPHEPTETTKGEPSVADWIARIAPAAAPFARIARAPGSAAEPASPGANADPEATKLAEARLQKSAARGTRRVGGKLLLLWVLLIMMFLAIWQFLAPDPGAPATAGQGPSDTLAPFLAVVFPLLVVLAVAGAFTFVVVRARSHVRRLEAAIAELARGDEAQAEAELTKLSRSAAKLVAAQASFQLALLAERRTDFAAAIEHCDRGIAAAVGNPTVRVVSSSILLPELLAERAFVLAATGRAADAGAEMALVAGKYPTFPYRARAELRVALIERLAGAGLAGAAQLCEASTDDLPLSLRDETLVDLVRAAARPEAVGAGEVERLQDELRRDAELRRWLDAVAPAALSAFDRGGDGGDAGREAEAEREAAAEEEAARAATLRAVPG
jgi:hypothetical protein